VDFFLHTAHTAQLLLLPHVPPLDLSAAAPGVRTEPLPDAAAALAWLDTEHAGLLAAQLTAAEQDRDDVVCQLASSLIVFHDRRGHREADLAVCRTALAAAGRLADPGFRIRACRNIGYAYGRLGRHEEAVSHFRRGLALAERHNPSQAAHIHRALAWAWEEAGDGRQALEHARQALRRFRELGDSLGEARALNLMGWCLARVGEYGTAGEYSRAALVRNREHDNPDGEAYALGNLGYLGFHTGRHEESVRHYEQALSLYRSLEYTIEVATALEGIGHPHAALGRVEAARKAWREARELYSRLGRDADAERLNTHLDPT
jgi:tetratricopeptide (TPR) repeat protein